MKGPKVDLYHAKRRKDILKAHPEVRDLVRCDPSSKYVALALSFTQLAIAYSMRNEPIGLVISTALLAGTAFNFAIGNAMHEILHEAVLDSMPLACKFLNGIVNLGVGVPTVGGFHYSHRNHHAYLGSDLDAKFPTYKEAMKYDQNVWDRLKFIFGHPVLTGSRWEGISPETANGPYATWNKRTVWLADALMLYFWGYKSLLYLAIAYFVNDTIFIQGAKNYVDHWVSETESYTNSYYGFFNLFCYNIGYHREHHDFPNVPSRYLPLVKEWAPEFYQDEKYIFTNLWSAVWDILKAKPGQGLTKHANKMTIKQATGLDMK